MSRRVSLCQNVAKSCRIGTALTRLDVLCIWNKAFVFFPCSQFDFTRIRVYIVLRIGSINTTPGGKDNGKNQAFLERVVFPWLSYNDFSLSVTKKMPTTFIYTMNATEEYLPELEPQLGHIENLVSLGFGPVERIVACNTTQVMDYSRYEMAAASQGKAEYREQHWEQDLQKAYEAGKRMVQRIGS